MLNKLASNKFQFFGRHCICKQIASGEGFNLLNHAPGLIGTGFIYSLYSS